uniref:PWI domain-containing protein n=1 Tax=Naja naja TaxID=35670 RepID=A0A8C6X934_NAJNA
MEIACCKPAGKGTSAEQDNRFSNKQKKLLKQLKFAECLEKKVDMSKVNLEVIKPWITKRVTEILGFEDDVVIEFIFNQLEVKVIILLWLFFRIRNCIA